MRAESIAGFPELPESVPDWEDLLLRLEIVPRVVRNAVEEALDRELAAGTLRAAVERESGAGERLERAAGLYDDARAVASATQEAEPEALARRFASLRARTFAMVQRRGLEVWEWRTQLEGGGSATVHQLLLWLAAQDGELLAQLRRASRSAPAGC